MGEEKKKKRNILDKVLMGAIIGGAIGSVMGASIAPKKGEETRKELAQAAKKAKTSGSKIIKRIKKNKYRKNHDTTHDNKGSQSQLPGTRRVGTTNTHTSTKPSTVLTEGVETKTLSHPPLEDTKEEPIEKKIPHEHV